MNPSDKMIDALPGTLVVEMMLGLTHFFFPESQRQRFEQVADEFERKTQSEWLAVLKEKKKDLHDAFLDMRNSMDQVYSDSIVGSWSDEVLFFYILRIQYVFLRMASSKDHMLPGTITGFWDWGMGIKEDDPWMLFPVFTADGVSAVETKIPIWRIPYPTDYPK